MQSLAILVLLMTGANDGWTLGGWTGSSYVPVSSPRSKVVAPKEVKSLPIPETPFAEQKVPVAEKIPGCLNGACICGKMVCLAGGHNCIGGCPGSRKQTSMQKEESPFPALDTSVLAGKRVPSKQKMKAAVTNNTSSVTNIVQDRSQVPFQWHWTTEGWLYGQMYNGMVYPAQQPQQRYQYYTSPSCAGGTCRMR